MQSESDSDSEFFDAPEKLSLSGSFTSDLRCVPILSDMMSALVRKLPRMHVFWRIFFYFFLTGAFILSVAFGKFLLNGRI